MIRSEPKKGTDEVIVTFVVPKGLMDAPGVTLVGDFNDWDPTATPLRNHGGQWSTSLTLDAGRRYAFRYLGEGMSWFNDEAPDDYQPNEFGGSDSVVDLTKHMTAGRSAVRPAPLAQSTDQAPEQARSAAGTRDSLGPEAPSEAAGQVAELARGFAERFWAALNVAASRGDYNSRPRPQAPNAMERVICVRDLFHSTAAQLERLAGDVCPLEGRCIIREPIAGYHRWDPDEVISVLVLESDRLSRLTQQLVADTRLPAGIRRGMVLIIADLLGCLMAQSTEQLSGALSLLSAGDEHAPNHRSVPAVPSVMG